jgi:PAS domain S-box-containing protein
MSIGDGVIAVGVEERVRSINHVAAELTGWPEEEAVGRPIAEVFNILNEDRTPVKEMPVTKAICEGVFTGNVNFILITKTGLEIPIEDGAAPIRDGKGQITGAVVVFRDIRERRRHEEEREQALAREQALRVEVTQSAQAQGRAHDRHRERVRRQGRAALRVQAHTERNQPLGDRHLAGCGPELGASCVFLAAWRPHGGVPVQERAPQAAPRQAPGLDDDARVREAIDRDHAVEIGRGCVRGVQDHPVRARPAFAQLRIEEALDEQRVREPAVQAQALEAEGMRGRAGWKEAVAELQGREQGSRIHHAPLGLASSP